MEAGKDLTILMPCLNEEETLKECIIEAKKTNPEATILIADNGSTDRSVEIAHECGAQVVHVQKKGYGNVLQAGIKHAQTEFVIMADSDMSYNFGDANKIVNALREGADLVMGNRFQGGIQKGAMPWLHKYLGNPVLSKIGQLLYDLPIGDFHCGIRGVRRAKFENLPYLSTGMEWASEMILLADAAGYQIQEVPCELRKDKRNRKPHLRTWRDGWRHLKVLLIFSPTWLFKVPGLLLFIFGWMTLGALSSTTIKIGEINLGVHTTAFAGCAIILGLQSYLLGKITEEMSRLARLHKRRKKIPNMEWGLITGIASTALGLIAGAYSYAAWASQGFGGLIPEISMKTVILSTTLLISGGVLIFTSFVGGLLEMQGQKQEPLD